MRSLLRQIPGIAWVIVLACSLVAGGLWGLVRQAERRGAVRVERAAVRDSVVHQAARVATVTAHADSGVRASRIRQRDRAAVRAQVELVDSTSARVAGVVAQLPAPVVTLIQRDDATITSQAATIDTLLVERALRTRLDELREHQVSLEDSGSGSLALPLAIGIALLEAVLLVLSVLR